MQQYDPIPDLTRAIARIDSLWQQRQAEIDLDTINRFRLNHLHAQAWGLTLPACPVNKIVEGSISEVDDAG